MAIGWDGWVYNGCIMGIPIGLWIDDHPPVGLGNTIQLRQVSIDYTKIHKAH